MHQCTVCHYKTKDKSNLTKHIKSVHKEQEHISEVKDVKQEFASNGDKKILAKLPYLEPANTNSENSHTDSEHSNGSEDQYEIDNQQSKTASNLHEEKAKNNGINQNISNARFYCFQCSVTFPTQDFLKYHLATVHDIKKHQCNICDYMTKKESDLKRHMQTFHKEQEKTTAVQNMKQEIQTNDDKRPGILFVIACISKQ